MSLRIYNSRRFFGFRRAETRRGSFQCHTSEEPWQEHWWLVLAWVVDLKRCGKSWLMWVDGHTEPGRQMP
jgi:hypothetical protein